MTANTGLVLKSSTGPVILAGSDIVLARPLIITWMGDGSQDSAGTGVVLTRLL